MNIQGHQRELSSTHFLDLLFFGAHNAEGFFWDSAMSINCDRNTPCYIVSCRPSP